MIMMDGRHRVNLVYMYEQLYALDELYALVTYSSLANIPISILMASLNEDTHSRRILNVGIGQLIEVRGSD